MGVKDIKILWVKAAARCSICRISVLIEADSPSSKTLIGETCHIVGEKLTEGPRHESNLSLSERNRYPNLILLCANHHTEIDNDVKKYTVEKLHQIKSDHELWIETLRTENEDSAAKKLYSSLINSITEELRLYKWENISDNALRCLLHSETIQGMRNTTIKLNRIQWPGEIMTLEKSIIELGNRLHIFIDHFMELGYERRRNIWAENKTWKKEFLPHDQYTLNITRSKEWQRKNTDNLWNMTVALNRFAAEVRNTINPEFFLLQGDFIISDEMGISNHTSEDSIIYFPKEYKT
ncbi:MAG TPA: hypothetical protein PLX69_17550 [Leptospiraceae bacterium]|nr:hypothetical protein [Leptospiraceae bacterium]